jgi:hypothetical protein
MIAVILTVLEKHIFTQSTLIWHKRIWCFYLCGFLANLAYKNEHRQKYPTPLSLSSTDNRLSQWPLTSLPPNNREVIWIYIYFSHNSINCNSQWLNDLALCYEINTDRQVIYFNNGYNFHITIIQSIFSHLLMRSPTFTLSKYFFI